MSRTSALASQMPNPSTSLPPTKKICIQEESLGVWVTSKIAPFSDFTLSE